MAASWNFAEVRPGDKTREPIQGEFFTNDSIGRSGEALVREGIQNALDAGLPNETVHVRIFVSGPGAGVPSSEHRKYFDSEVWSHLQSNGNGLSSPPEPSQDCCFIAFEDFGTTGLQGDVEQYHPVAGTRNPFYHFIRAEGRSDKGEHERGRWGVGKFVFPSASDINTVLCASVRADDSRRVLIGQTVLKTHEVRGKVFTPDGFYGDLAKNGLTLPIEDSSIFDQVCSTFKLKRKNRSGLSIIIPWYDTGIDAKALIEATVIGYFYPILAGRLTVSIETPSSKHNLNAESIANFAEELAAESGVDISASCRLATFACQFHERHESQAPDQKHSVKWHSNMLSDLQKMEILAKLDANGIVGVRIPLIVKKKSGENEDAFFDIFLTRDASSHSERPVFVREGIIISDVQARRLHGHRALVLVEDGHLATLLGDAENPSHTRWENGSNFKGKYKYGTSYINFITNATSTLLAALSESEQEVDRTLLSDFFSLPDNELNIEGSTGGNRKRSKKRVKPTPPIIPRSRPRYRITRLEGGFQIQGTEDTTPPGLIEVKVAYDVRRGSALNKYNTADFQLGQNGIGVQEYKAVTVVSQSENRLILQIEAANFSCAVSGFDRERDLYIDARAKESTDDR